jgi:hypothetical protein
LGTSSWASLRWIAHIRYIGIGEDGMLPIIAELAWKRAGLQAFGNHRVIPKILDC